MELSGHLKIFASLNLHDNGPDLCICYLRAAHFFIARPTCGLFCRLHFGAGIEEDPKINRIIRNNLLRIFEILGFVELISQIRCAFIPSNIRKGMFGLQWNEWIKNWDSYIAAKVWKVSQSFFPWISQWVYYSQATCPLCGMLLFWNSNF